MQIEAESIMDGRLIQEASEAGTRWTCTLCGEYAFEPIEIWRQHLDSIVPGQLSEVAPTIRYPFWDAHARAHYENKRTPEEVAQDNARVALDRQAMHPSRMQEGRRNNHLNRTAYIEGRAAIKLGLDPHGVTELLREAALTAGLSHTETEATLRSGLGQ